jgi:hypothetical protein
MIAWWGWLLIWIGLVLGLLAMLAFFAWRLVKRFLLLLEELGELTGKLSLLEGETAGEQVRPPSSILAGAAAARESYGLHSDSRANLRATRRRARIERAKLLTSKPITMKEWPHEHG